jgi:hypothetical protein
MATVPYTESVKNSVLGTVITITWTPVSSGDQGEPYFLGAIPDASVVLLGTLGTMLLQGSNELPLPLNWFTLTNEAHTAITEAGGARIEQILQSPAWIRPNASGVASGATILLTIRKHVPR